MIQLKSFCLFYEHNVPSVPSLVSTSHMVPSSPSTIPTSGHTCKPTIRDARMTEQLERKQRVDHERRAKHKHIELLGVICAHGRDVLAVNRAVQD
jgi:hypothetical protein